VKSKRRGGLTEGHIGTMCSALTLFSEQMDSTAFRVLATGLLIVLVVNVIVNFGFTVRAIARREVLILKEDPRLKKKS
jgi:tellurite resistance protein TehA-like permease